MTIGLLALGLAVGSGCGSDPTGGGGDATSGDVTTDGGADSPNDTATTPGNDSAATSDSVVEPIDVAAAIGDCDTSAWLETQVGAASLRVNYGTGEWQLEQHGHTLAGPGGCGDASPVQIAGDGDPYVEYILGAFQFDMATVGWHGTVAGGTASVTEETDAVELRWTLVDDLGTAGVRFSVDDAGHVRVTMVADGSPRGGIITWSEAGADTGYFGLGAQVAGLNLRGRAYPLWTQEQGIGKSDTPFFPLENAIEASYAPMGVWHSSAGWSGVAATDAWLEIDLRAPSATHLRSYGELPAMAVVFGETPRDQMIAVTELVGRIEPPAPWTFGPWNDAVGGPDRLHEVAESLREHGIPSSAIWSEDWIGGNEGPSGFRLSYAWAWDPETYPDLPGDITWLHDHGYAFLGYFNSFVVSTTDMWDEGVAGDYLIETADGGPYVFIDPAQRDASLVDLTNPAAVDWLKGYLTTAATDLGIDGWMADFSEWLPHDAILHNGEDAWVGHNRYAVLWQQANRDALTAAHAGGPATAEGWTFFARSGWASTNLASASSTPTMWAGDQDTDWDRDDGLPSIIPIGAHLGLAGVAIYGSDIAGYSSFIATPTNKELFYRWTTIAALHPLMRTHHGSSECANWSFDRDSETVAHYRRWARIHTRLYPTYQALADEAVTLGLPITRHPWLVEPDARHLWDGEDAFFIGDDLLVLPVVEEGATNRQLELPGEGWWALFGSGKAGNPSMVAAPATELPVYVRGGTILPLLVEAVDSFYGAVADGVRDLADEDGRRALALYPAVDGSLDTVEVMGATITGTGFVGGTDWTTVTLNGDALPSCPLELTGSCVNADNTLSFVGSTATLVVAGGGTLQITSDVELTWLIGMGGAVWGELAEPTPLTDLDPDVPPPCEEH